MSNITINFDTLKYNLYEVLGINSNASETKIKKAFRNLILNFHPDKNNNIEEEIYYHIITANQILTNTESRKKYDDFLNKSNDTHDELKNTFTKTKQTIYTNVDDEIKYKFNYTFNELDKKHLSSFTENDKTIDAYNKLLKERDKTLEIPKEDIKTNNEFNEKFESRIVDGSFIDQIIPISEKMELTINSNENYTSLDVAFNNLYVDSSGISNSKYTSLDSAFKIQKINPKDFKEVNIKEAIEIYKNETNNLNYMY